ncbi:Hint domain-containing protein [Aporhodopirellula aestuarii]|uniref:DUF4159 domain-containing protein n=1 Tax=Aporhodopirellula aestuarii TaxID=2950107 RepID=A0ABT0U1W0_9BACT|nr:hypothetical protein [Aporhodopirellula aestuarii]MCM2370876.1 hypothetical protein [Aporhodopirellula aestuarii]
MPVSIMPAPRRGLGYAARILLGVVTVSAIIVMSPVRLLAQSNSASLDAIDPQPAARFLRDGDSLVARFPTGTTNRLGWTMRVWISSHLTADTMRVELEFATTGGPTTADLNLDLRLTPKPDGHSPPQSSLRASLPIQIPEGTERVRLARHLPKSSFGNYYLVQLLEDGRAIRNCQSDVGSPISYRDSEMYVNALQQSLWEVLWVESEIDAPSRNGSMQMWTLINTPSPYRIATDPQEWERRMSEPEVADEQGHFRSVKPGSLPADWRAYRPFDAVMMHGEDWQSISEAGSPQAIALREWIQSGGILVVRDAAAPDQALGSSNAYRTPSRETLREGEQGCSSIAARYDSLANANSDELSRELSYSVNADENVQLWRDWLPSAAEQIRTSLKQYPPAHAMRPDGVRARNELAGMIVYLGKQSRDDGTTGAKADSEQSSGDDRTAVAPIQALQWWAALNLMSWQRSRLIRSGVDPILGSQRFFQWVIPGVSQPPVYTFMGLLGLFVILVGPVAYRKTAKAGRSYLMFAIAPILAIGTTAAMLGYGVIADGFETRLRVRQITWVDGTTGDASTRSRSTYFAGIRPSNGLSFPPDSEVTLYPDNQSRDWESRIGERFDSRGLVTASANALNFDRDFLPSRQQRQFVTVQPRSSWGRIRIGENTSSDPLPVIKPISAEQPLPSGKDTSQEKPLEGPESMIVYSESDVPLHELIVCDAKLRYYYTEELPARSSAIAVQISKKNASERMGEMYKRQWLISDVVERRRNNSANNRSYDNGTSDIVSEQLNAFATVVKPTDGVFEYELQQRMQLQSDLPANSFLGLTDISADAIAIPGTNVYDSIHYVMGTLP